MSLPAKEFALKIMKILPDAKGIGAISHPLLGKRIQKDFQALSKLLQSIWPELSNDQKTRLDRYKDMIDAQLKEYHDFAQYRVYEAPGATWRGAPHMPYGFTDEEFQEIKDYKPHKDTGICKAYVTLLNEIMDSLLQTLKEMNPKACEETPFIKDMIIFYHNCTIMGKVFNNL